ncbi:MAG: AMP-binding protein [Silicimonas sp.]|nr:AMP-binding protein [Silicimonas sp.]
MARLLDDFARAVADHPDRVAIVDGSGHSVSFAQLQSRADDFARAWAARGIKSGDRVLLAMRLDADLYAALAALWNLGATVVLPEPAMGIAGLRHAARVADASAFCSSGLYGLLKFILPELWSLPHLRPRDRSGQPLPDADASDDDIALISFTSGTSGAPKAIPRSHRFLSAQHNAIAPLLQSDAPERDLVAFPVFVLINIAGGRTSILPNWKMSRLAQLSPVQMGRWMADQSVTRALLPPSLCEKLADASAPASLHAVFTGGGPVFPNVLDRMWSAHPRLQIHCVYGSTEAEPIAHFDANTLSPEDRAAMTAGQGLLVGRPVDDIDLRIDGDEVQVAGPHVNEGYLDPRHDAENKINDGTKIWHRTGDAGTIDEDGRLWLLGRTGTEMEIEGRRTFPFSIETAVRLWPGVRQCALMERQGSACLVIEGDAEHLSDWRKAAADLGIARVEHAKIPMDRRHASKVDRAALKTSLGL